MAVSRVVSEIFNVEEYRDLEIPVKSQSRSLKVVSFDRLGICEVYSSLVGFIEIYACLLRAVCLPSVYYLFSYHNDFTITA